MAASNELIALSSLGISPFKVIRPVLLVATLLSLGCVWLYDIGEWWGQKGIHQVLIDSAEEIAYRFLRTKHSYAKGEVSLNVKSVEGRRLIRPTLVVEPPGLPRAGHRVRRRRGAAQQRPRAQSVDHHASRHGLYRQRGLDGLSGHDGTSGGGGRNQQPRALAAAIPQPGEPGGRPRKSPHVPGPTGKGPAAVAGRLDGHAAPSRWLRRRKPWKPSASHLHWIESQIHRRWTNGFFCLAYVIIGIPVAMHVRSRDYLTSFFACFLPVVVFNHPLHNICIKMAEAGRAPR